MTRTASIVYRAIERLIHHFGVWRVVARSLLIWSHGDKGLASQDSSSEVVSRRTKTSDRITAMQKSVGFGTRALKRGIGIGEDIPSTPSTVR